MIRKNQPILNFLNIASDFILITLSYPMAMYTRLELLGGHSQMPLLSPPYSFMAGCCAILTVFVYYILGLYGSQRLKHRRAFSGSAGKRHCHLSGHVPPVPYPNHGVPTLGSGPLLALLQPAGHRQAHPLLGPPPLLPQPGI